MEQPSSVAAESKPQPDARAPQPAAPESPAQPDSEARYQRRSGVLNHPRTRWGLILIGLVILIGIFFLWRYLTSYEATAQAQIDRPAHPAGPRGNPHRTKPH